MRAGGAEGGNEEKEVWDFFRLGQIPALQRGALKVGVHRGPVREEDNRLAGEDEPDGPAPSFEVVDVTKRRQGVSPTETACLSKRTDPASAGGTPAKAPRAARRPS
jgi:hypothetical protein